MSFVAYWQNGYSDAQLGKEPYFSLRWNNGQQEAYDKGYEAGTKPEPTGEKQVA